RHTRSKRDWSSDVCSSDLLGVHLPQSAAESEEVTAFMERYRRNTKIFYAVNVVISTAVCAFCFWYISVFMIVWSVWLLEFCVGEIGRASCRERVWLWVVVG